MINDCLLIAKKNNFDFKWNSKFPINSLNIMRGYLSVNSLNRDQYIIFFETIKDPAIKEKLKDATKNAHEKEVFGAPTFIVNNKLFWGQDRLEFALDEYNKID